MKSCFHGTHSWFRGLLNIKSHVLLPQSFLVRRFGLRPAALPSCCSFSASVFFLSGIWCNLLLKQMFLQGFPSAGVARTKNCPSTVNSNSDCQTLSSAYFVPWFSVSITSLNRKKNRKFGSFCCRSRRMYNCFFFKLGALVSFICMAQVELNFASFSSQIFFSVLLCNQCFIFFTTAETLTLSSRLYRLFCGLPVFRSRQIFPGTFWTA